MPELPEAETLRLQLEPQIVGRQITAAWSRLPRRTSPSIPEFVERCTGQWLLAARRRGKQLYFPLESGDSLLIHLGMTGRLHCELGHGNLDEDVPPHVQARWQLDNGQRLVFTDPRTFGQVGVARELPFLSAMGPEPLDEDFDVEAMAVRLGAKHVKIKAVLLDQSVVAGLGSIYADEICFRARVHPATRADRISQQSLVTLVSFMRPVLTAAIAARGATLLDKGYQDLFGQYGEFVPAVYGRHGQECLVCGTQVVRDRLGPGKSARSYHFCPSCQPLPPDK